MLTSRNGSASRQSQLRPSPSDVAVGVVLAFASAALTLALPVTDPYRDPGPLGAAVVGLAAFALVWRRVLPVTVLAVASLGVVVSAALQFNVVLAQWPPWIALATCFAKGDRRSRYTGSAVAVLGVAGYAALDRAGPAPETLVGIAMSFAIATVAGDATHTRRRIAAVAAAQVVAEERAGLARELHDALGHAVNVMVLQAGVGRRVFGTDPRFAHEALSSIEQVGRGALEELDRMLRVLQPDRVASLAPHHETEPGLADLDELGARIRATGRPVSMRTDSVELADSGGRTVYRIVQEALTNAVRHTSSGAISVSLTQQADKVVVEVTNAGTGFRQPVAGRGLVGMRERARLEGGRLEAGPVPEGFRVRATLPARPSPNV